MKYSLKHLNYLTALAKHKSFSKAAESCHVTQSTLSLGIKELERQMDVTLFERNRKNIIPTAAGEMALRHAANILSLNHTMHLEMERIKNPNAGPLRISVIPTIAPYFLPTALPVLEDHFPDSTLYISEDTTDTVLSKINDGQTDLGILALPVFTGDLESRPLFKEPFVVAASKNQSLPKTFTTKDLNQYELLLLRDGHCLKDHVISACQLPKGKQNQFFEAESLQTLLAMVNQNYGITLVPQMAIASGITKSYANVTTRPFLSPAPTRQIGLVWRRSDLRSHQYLKVDF